ncbi:MAG: hypothetical protein H6Q05_4216, partial [Acidobacteria bacterium]|nr:hypothetical protein [Acidobacteriota bacterium]
ISILLRTDGAIPRMGFRNLPERHDVASGPISVSALLALYRLG